MKPRYHFAILACFAAALASPGLIVAHPQPNAQNEQYRDDKNTNKRIYDSSHKDYHTWNGNEDRTWRQYQSNQHRDYRDFSKASKKEQSEYWNWRHDHPDSDRH
jgi:hypothetical protein